MILPTLSTILEDLSVLNVEQARALPYVDLLALLQETNRCPGGTRTILKLIRNAHVDRQSRVLEIGSNTGFTSLEIARIAKCKVIGIDVNASVVETARSIKQGEISTVRELLTFDVASVLDIPFEDDSFDLVVAGGALSFVNDKQRALSEIQRVMKPWGFFSATNLCCISEPDFDVIRRVSDIIGVELIPRTAEDWIELYDKVPSFQRTFEACSTLGIQSEDTVNAHVELFRTKPHLKAMSPMVINILMNRWKYIMHTFNENHRYLGYVELMYRKCIGMEPELFVPPSHSL